MCVMRHIAVTHSLACAQIACLPDGNCLSRAVSKFCNVAPGCITQLIVTACREHVDLLERKWAGEILMKSADGISGTARWCALHAWEQSHNTGVAENEWSYTPHWLCGTVDGQILAAQLNKRLVIIDDNSFQKNTTDGCTVVEPGQGSGFRERFVGTAVRMIQARNMQQELCAFHTSDTIYLLFGQERTHFNLIDFRAPLLVNSWGLSVDS